MNVQWQREDPVTVESLDALDALLDRLHDEAATAERLIAVTLHDENSGHGLIITVGADHAMAQWSDQPGIGEMTSRPSEPVNPGNVPRLPIDFGGQPSSVPANCFFPAEHARAGARTYFETGRRPPEIPWPDSK